MNSLTTRGSMREPVHELRTMRSLMDSFFNEPFFSAPSLWSQRNDGFPLPLDLIEEDGQYIVKASMPGVNPEDVEITLTDNVLTIKGESKQETEDHHEANYHVRERRYGSFMRQIALPMGVNVDAVEATNEHGVLTLHLPKSEASMPKKIVVKTTVDSKSAAPTNGS